MSSRVLRSIIVGGLALAIGVGGMLILFSLRKAPAEASAVVEERSIHVTAIEAVPEDIVVRISGYGEVRPVRSVEIASELSGSVIEVNPNLIVGGQVKKGDVLFAIDARVYETELTEIEAQLARWNTTLRRLRTEKANDESRLKTLKRSRDLAQKKYERTEALFEQTIGNRTEMEEAEEHYNDTLDRVEQLAREVSIYPILIEETEHSLSAEKARRDRATINVEQTKVRAPFDARVTTVGVEEGHFASMGVPVVTLADDSSLEIAVKLDAKDARDWLRFDELAENEHTAWFAGLSRVACQVRWVEEDNGATWGGTLHRVEEFDADTRSLTVTIRVDGDVACRSESGLPLVSGMFCEVTIPGRMLHDVYRLPQWAVGVDGSAFLAKEERLQPLPVEIRHTDGETIFVSGDIQPGDTIVTTRLINPMANTLLNVVFENDSPQPTTD